MPYLCFLPDPNAKRPAQGVYRIKVKRLGSSWYNRQLGEVAHQDKHSRTVTSNWAPPGCLRGSAYIDRKAKS